MQQTPELWAPKGHADRLVVGARVRVRLSGECDALWTPWASSGHRLRDIEEGRTGTIAAPPYPTPNLSHLFGVRYDEALIDPDTGARIPGSFYATTELELLDTDAPDAQQQRAEGGQGRWA